MRSDIDETLNTRIVRRDAPVAERPARPPLVPARPREPGEFKVYFKVLLDNRMLILLVAFVVGLAGLLYALSARPVYEANMTFQVEEGNPNGPKNLLSDATSLYDPKRVTVAEMEVLRSRRVIAPVVEALHLDVEVQPDYFPVVGAGIARARRGVLSQPGLFGRGGYVWGGEKLTVATFSVPAALQQRTFIVTATNGGYRLTDEQGSFAWDGQVGTPLRGALSGGEVTLDIALLEARPGARFFLRHVSRLSAVTTIRNALVIAEQGKQSGIVEVKLQGEFPGRVHAILDGIAREYLRQAVAHKREEAEKSLAFLDGAINPLRAQLNESEALYGQFHQRHGTINLADETRVGVEQAAATKARRAELLQRKSQLLSKFTENHPVVAGINNQLRALDEAVRTDNDNVRKLAAMEQDEQTLTRDTKVRSELYNELSSTAQQLRILAANMSGNVRLIDAPNFPEAPIKPNRPQIVAAAIMAGLLLGMMGAFFRRAVYARVDAPGMIEQMVGSKIIQASIPHSRQQVRLVRQAGRGKIGLLAHVAQEDPAIEALRGVRAALQFALPHFRNNIVMITGPTAGLGKSFLSANAAAVIAASGKRVLLVDADLRAAQLHRYVGVERSPGLCDAIAGDTVPAEIIHRGVSHNLDFLAAGAWQGSPSELLTHPGFAKLLLSMREQYDLVLIDAPPLLGVADALTIAAHAGGVFLLTRARTTTQDEAKEAIKRLHQTGIAIEGVLFNDVKGRQGEANAPAAPGAVHLLDWTGAR